MTLLPELTKHAISKSLQVPCEALLNRYRMLSQEQIWQNINTLVNKMTTKPYSAENNLWTSFLPFNQTYLHTVLLLTKFYQHGTPMKQEISKLSKTQTLFPVFEIRNLCYVCTRLVVTIRNLLSCLDLFVCFPTRLYTKHRYIKNNQQKLPKFKETRKILKSRRLKFWNKVREKFHEIPD